VRIFLQIITFAASKEGGSLMIDLLEKGGVVIIPLMLCSVIAVAIFLERLVYFWSVRSDADELISDVKSYLRQSKVVEALQTAKRTKGPVGAMAVAGISAYGKSPEEVKERIEAAGALEISKLEKNLPYLETLTTVTPLLGLLGTVVGIIRNFNILSLAQGLASTGELSGGIDEALIATATGLCIAIPTMVIHSYFSARVEKHIADMNKRSVDLIEILTVRSDG
jgi:biopolymer transport protein ExbB